MREVKFPGYRFEAGKNLYRGEDVGKGGYVYAEPGMYSNIALLDVRSLHPTSMLILNYYGEYSDRFKDIYDARQLIKEHNYEDAGKLMNGLLKPYLTDEGKADSLAQALKIAINSTYGLTAASFDNPFRDPRNINNIVALCGALFMVDLKHEVQNRGYKVAHIKTDSIKIPNATPEIIKFCMDYAADFGYIFEHEATYDRMCLINDAVYIARYYNSEKCENMYGYIPKDNRKHSGEWTATGTQFAVPYVFKTLFSKEPIIFEDKCETKTVSTSMYLDMNEGKEDEHDYHFIGKAGLFCPIKKGCGGGLLVAQRGEKYDSVTGTKGYRWLESEMVKSLDKEKDIDELYYKTLVTNAINDISKFGDFEWFVSDDVEPLPDFMNIPEDAPEPGVPWD